LSHFSITSATKAIKKNPTTSKTLICHELFSEEKMVRVTDVAKNFDWGAQNKKKL